MTISVVVPAYNESGVIGRLLDALADPAYLSLLEVVVVCNGCVDGTEDVAAAHPLRPTVLSLEIGSKHAALVAGDAAAAAFPRFYVDADVIVSARDLVTLARALDTGPLAVAPERDLRLDRSAWAVRAYYRVWLRLAAVDCGLWGRGVLGISESGFGRLASRPDVLGDDLYAHNQFGPDERRVVPGTLATIFGPRTLGDLVRRRVRAAWGNAQPGAGGAPSRTSLREVASLGAAEPTLLPSVAVFTLVSVVSRLLASAPSRRQAWLRDESSRVVDPSGL